MRWRCGDLRRRTGVLGGALWSIDGYGSIDVGLASFSSVPTDGKYGIPWLDVCDVLTRPGEIRPKGYINRFQYGRWRRERCCVVQHVSPTKKIND